MHWVTLVESFVQAPRGSGPLRAPKGSGIYILEWGTTDQFYIGRTVDAAKRLRQHVRYAEKGYRIGARLKNTIRKHGAPTLRMLYPLPATATELLHEYEGAILLLVVPHPRCANGTTNPDGGTLPYVKAELQHVSGERVSGYLSHLARDLKLNSRLLSQVVKGRRASHKGWYVPGRAPGTTRGSVHILHKGGETVMGTVGDLAVRLGVSSGAVSNVVRGRSKSVRGWVLHPSTAPGAPARGQVVRLWHPIHGLTTGTQAFFCAKYTLQSSHVSAVCRGQRLSCKGWRLPERSQELAPGTGASHTFVHPEHGQVTCTQAELACRYGLSASKVCLVVRGRRKRHKQWEFVTDA